MLKQVTIFGLPEEKYLAGSNLVRLDSSLKSNDRSRNLSEIFPLQLPIYFRTYGNGMLSSISMRGTSPQHTSVLWNGININSFSLGQADFSILPANAFDEIKIHEGAGSARFGSGAFGGTVLLNSSSSQKNSISFSQDVGSFGRYFSSINAAWLVNKWGFKTKLYNLSSENNFPVLLTGDRQQHAAFRQSGILQDVEYRWSSAKTISLHYWYHDADRDIQPSIGQQNSQDNQQDRSHRLSIRYQSNSRLGLLSLNGGYVKDEIVYNGSASNVIRWISGAKHEFAFAKSFHTQVGAEWNHIIGNIPNYENGQAKEDRYDFTASIQKNISERFSVAVNLRQPVVSGFNAPFLPYLGMEYAIMKSTIQDLKVRGSISKNYRVPTLNDRYWQNAGDKNLLPETTHAGEFGVNYRFKTFEIVSSFFSQSVDDWIQWIPDVTGNYRPKNIQQVLAQGIEVKISLRQKIDKVTIIPMLTYQLTKSISTQAPADEQYTIDKQLIYTPRHTASGYVQLIWKKTLFDISAQYNGKRYTDSSNSDTYALPAFALLNASIGKFWISNQHRFDFRLAVKNLLNTDYQLYAAHAMPGRNYNLQFTYQLNSKSN
ncbi:MAG TPA: TonB-dependent receptor [Cyclobacteriaceae bacterium]|jgi:iron complex outermembrane receptor protein|nr:TonB-dependent receptor [Cyclobacteriaceae bacterium]